MTAAAIVEDRRLFTLGGAFWGAARRHEIAWLAPLRKGARELARYLMGQLKSHSRVSEQARAVAFRAKDYAKLVGVTRQTACTYAEEIVSAGIFRREGHRKRWRMVLNPPPLVGIDEHGRAFDARRKQRYAKKTRLKNVCDPRTDKSSRFVKWLLPNWLARLRDLGWPSGSKRSYFDWLHEAQNSSNLEADRGPIYIQPARGLGRAHRSGEPQPRPLGNPVTDRRSPPLGLRTLGGAAEVRERTQTGPTENNPSRSDSGPPRLELPQAQMARANDVAISRERTRDPRPTDVKRAKREARPPGTPRL